MESYYLKYLKYKSKYLNLLNVLKGGKEIGKGGYGIVFRPPLNCEPRKEEFENDNYVGKIMSYKDAQEELINSNKVRLLDPTGEWSITVVHESYYNDKQPQENDYKQEYKTRHPYQLISKFGGKSLKKLISYDADEPSKLDVSKIPLFIKLVKDTVIAIDALNAGGYSHGDLHIDNIIYDEIDGKIRLIDFGRLKKLDDDSNAFFSNDFVILHCNIEYIIGKNIVKLNFEKLNEWLSKYRLNNMMSKTFLEFRDAILSLPDVLLPEIILTKFPPIYWSRARRKPDLPLPDSPPATIQ